MTVDPMNRLHLLFDRYVNGEYKLTMMVGDIIHNNWGRKTKEIIFPGSWTAENIRGIEISSGNMGEVLGVVLVSDDQNNFELFFLGPDRI